MHKIDMNTRSATKIESQSEKSKKSFNLTESSAQTAAESPTARKMIGQTRG